MATQRHPEAEQAKLFVKSYVNRRGEERVEVMGSSEFMQNASRVASPKPLRLWSPNSSGPSDFRTKNRRSGPRNEPSDLPTNPLRALGDLLPGLHLLPSEQLSALARAEHISSPQALLVLSAESLAEPEREHLALRIAAAAWEPWKELSLRELMPGLRTLVGEPIGWELRGPLRHALYRFHQVGSPPRWSDRLLLSAPGRWLRWPGVGLTSALQLLAAAIDAVIARAPVVPEPPALLTDTPIQPRSILPESQDPALAVAIDDLTTLAAWAEAEHGASSLLAALTLSAKEPELPPEVAAAVGRLGLPNLHLLASPQHPRFDIAAALERIVGSLE